MDVKWKYVRNKEDSKYWTFGLYINVLKLLVSTIQCKGKYTTVFNFLSDVFPIISITTLVFVSELYVDVLYGLRMLSSTFMSTYFKTNLRSLSVSSVQLLIRIITS